MYKLELMDGTIIDNITRQSPSTFFVEGDSSLYFIITDENLRCATLYKDDEIEDIWINYERYNFYCTNGVVEFRVRQKEELE